MNPAIFLDIVAYVLLIGTCIATVVSYRYWRKEKRECEKYPFYRLRSKICKAYLRANDGQREDVDDYDRLYAVVNDVARNLESFGFGFFSWSIARICDEFLADRGKTGTETQLRRPLTNPEIMQLTRELVDLLFDATKQNSWLVRISMTRIGYEILFQMHLLAAVIRFLKRRPDQFPRQRKNLEAIETGVKIRNELRFV